MRLFVGLEVPDRLKRAAAELQTELPGARWLAVEGFHVTLAFIGEVDGKARQRVQATLAGVRADPISLFLGGVGHFPSEGPPRVLWAGASPARALASLSVHVRGALVSAGLASESRKPAPHVTLARFRRPPPPGVLRDYLRAHADFRTPDETVSAFRLFSSTLRSSGALYAVEAEYPLVGEARIRAPVEGASLRP